MIPYEMKIHFRSYIYISFSFNVILFLVLNLKYMLYDLDQHMQLRSDRHNNES